MIQAARKVIISEQDQLLNQDGDRCEAYMRRVKGQQSKGGLTKIAAFQSQPGESLAGARCPQRPKSGLSKPD
jgi:hypothetical protein